MTGGTCELSEGLVQNTYSESFVEDDCHGSKLKQKHLKLCMSKISSPIHVKSDIIIAHLRV